MITITNAKTRNTEAALCAVIRVQPDRLRVRLQGVMMSSRCVTVFSAAQLETGQIDYTAKYQHIFGMKQVRILGAVPLHLEPI